MPSLYRKIYQRENSLVALGIWEIEQARAYIGAFGVKMVVGLHDVTGGLDTVYYPERGLEIFTEMIVRKMKQDPEFFASAMETFEQRFKKLEAFWKLGSLDSKESLMDLCALAGDVWGTGVDVVYCVPEGNVSEEIKQRALVLRGKTADFLDATDQVIRATLHKLYPQLGDLISFLTMGEATSGKIPSAADLEERKKHFVYFGEKVYVGMSVDEVAAANDIQIIRENAPPSMKDLKGQTAMKGKVQGRVRRLMYKSEIPTLQNGEILVTHMTTPDFVPAMRKAAAFVTDEGGITCHAAMIAREFGKPCVIGTKFATELLKTGDEVEVDADRGIVKLLTRV